VECWLCLDLYHTHNRPTELRLDKMPWRWLKCVCDRPLPIRPTRMQRNQPLTNVPFLVCACAPLTQKCGATCCTCTKSSQAVTPGLFVMSCVSLYVESRIPSAPHLSTCRDASKLDWSLSASPYQAGAMTPQTQTS